MFPYTAKNIKLQEKVFFCLKNSIVNTQLILFLYSKFKCLFELINAIHISILYHVVTHLFDLILSLLKIIFYSFKS